MTPAKQIIGQEQNLKLIDIAHKANKPALLIGETGTGKTSMVQFKAQETKNKVIRFNLTGETTVDEFVGKMIFKNQETIWQDGILLQAMKTGSWLIVDEINAALPEILFILHSLLDDDKQITVSNNKGEQIKPHKNFRFFATMNPVEEYSGTKDLNKAFLSRFPIVIHTHYPDNQTEIEILKTKTKIVNDYATKIVLLGNELRKLKQENKLFYTCSTRDLIHWAELSEYLDLDEAFTYTILNKAQSEKQVVIDSFVKIIGTIREIQNNYKIDDASFDGLKSELHNLALEKEKFNQEKKSIKKQLIEELLNKMQ